MVIRAPMPSMDDVGDPSDWPAGCEVVKALDSSLRCDLCFDIYTAPVSFKTCSHTFCSTCIRTHINQPGSAGAFCPKCRQNKAYDSELFPVTALETTAESWRKMRPFVMQLWTKAQDATREAERLRSHQNQMASGSLSRRPSEPNGKRKAEDDLEDAAIADGADHGADQPPRRSTRARTLRHPPSASNVGASADSAYILSDDDDEAGDASYQEESSAAPDKDIHDLKSDDQVACPICEHHFTVAALNAHLDKNKCYPGCPPPPIQERGMAPKPKAQGTPNSAAWFSKASAGNSNSDASGPAATAKRLHRPQYQLKSERDLRKLLESLGLPTTGDKEKLAERHRQYVNLYNANLDAAPANRRSEGKLRRELLEWERARDAKGSAITDKKSSSWLADNKAQYNDLIAQARETAMRDRQRRNKKPTPPPAAPADLDATEAAPAPQSDADAAAASLDGPGEPRSSSSLTQLGDDSGDSASRRRLQSDKEEGIEAR
ncbi:uncharacterized protein PFL1_03068 [Pseudozyma flocculosa PF-1]|uniref:Postreplication repair E3 ubiquitin-protein ligase RAD18 n=2 Tax=Pseudozyma flocculosa TaxID=84751 RepID=A0A5C3F267_9BASI|nr:uncharacterized protein PFL1_03068 [Pseudozyma flocculosa PF-1]EPQ29313.1 hypothetical protein PFL1_03068 [Pseudozyma flocculosa PF-1]SPO37827.1 related to postreplication repair protein uvsH/nuvA [Pseudozyma flocculosa]